MPICPSDRPYSSRSCGTITGSPMPRAAALVEATVPAASTAQRYRTVLSGVEIAGEVLHPGVDERGRNPLLRAETPGQRERDRHVGAGGRPRPQPGLVRGTPSHGERIGRCHGLHLLEVLALEERRPEAGSAPLDPMR